MPFGVRKMKSPSSGIVVCCITLFGDNGALHRLRGVLIKFILLSYSAHIVLQKSLFCVAIWAELQHNIGYIARAKVFIYS